MVITKRLESSPFKFFTILYGCILVMTYLNVVHVDHSNDLGLSILDQVFLSIDIVTLTGFSDHHIYDLSTYQLLLIAVNILISAFLYVYVVCWYFSKLVLGEGHQNFTAPKSSKKLAINLMGFFLLFIIGLIVPLLYAVHGNIEFSSFSDKLTFVLFQAVSSFSNAGFDLLNSGNYVFESEHLLIYHLIIASGVLAGGLGYFTFLDLGHYKNLRRRLQYPETDWRLFTKIAMIYTIIAAIIVVSSLYNTSDQEQPLLDKIFYALFISIHVKSGGFDISYPHFNVLTNSLLFIVLMFIGGNTCGTSGGIKSSTIYAFLQGIYQRVVNKSVPKQHSILFYIAFRIIIFGVLFNLLMAVLIYSYSDNKEFVQSLFLSVSAFANVGWGVDGMMEYNSVKIILMINMMTGRIILPLLVMNFLFSKLEHKNLKFLIT